MSKKDLPWRFQTNDDTGFDELVVGKGSFPCLLHAEMMNRRSIFVTVANLSIWAYVDKHGKAHVTDIEDNSGRFGRLPRTTQHKGKGQEKT